MRGLALIFALAGATSALAQGSAVPQPALEARHDGTYPGIGRFVAGQGCGSATTFPIVMTVSGGVATIPLRGNQGGLRGPVGAEGSLDALRWFGFDGVTETTRGRITGAGFFVDYVYDYPAAGHVRCNFVYEGQKRP